MKKYEIHKQHMQMEPVCLHEWEPIPRLSTKCLSRYECKKCGWLGYRMGNKVPVQVHTALSVDRIRSEDTKSEKSNAKEAKQAP